MSDTAFNHSLNEEIDILNCTALTDHTFSTLDSGTETSSVLLSIMIRLKGNFTDHMLRRLR